MKQPPRTGVLIHRFLVPAGNNWSGDQAQAPFSGCERSMSEHRLRRARRRALCTARRVGL